MFGFVAAPECDQIDHVMTLRRTTGLAHRLGGPGEPPGRDGVVLDAEQLIDLRRVAEGELERHSARALLHAGRSERRGLTEHDLRVREHLAAEAAAVQRALDALDSVREEA